MSKIHMSQDQQKGEMKDAGKCHCQCDKCRQCEGFKGKQKESNTQ